MNEIRSILAAVDLSATTATVLRTADALAFATGARLHLAHAIELDWQGFPAGAPSFPELSRRAERGLARAAARSLRRVKPSSLEVVLYARHRTITDRARQVKADLIVLGPHRHGTAALGTTADRVLRTSHCPIWIATESAHRPLGRIVMATDLSTTGTATRQTAVQIVRALGRSRPPVEVVLLHVAHPAVGKVLARKIRAMLEGEAAHWMEQFELSRSARVRTTMTRSRSAADGILSYLRRRAPDLLIMGTHGHGMLDRLLLGSVTARVLRAAPCNALAVPPRSTRVRTGRRK